MQPPTSYFDQSDYDIRFEWGLSGVEALAPTSDVTIIVDVLSFTTSVDIAVANGAAVYPYRGPAADLPAFAGSVGALVASHTGEPQPGYSLSPASLQTIPPGARLVLPSPNGSTLSLATGSARTLAGCLRNARAVAARARELGQYITVIAAGERWPGGLLRPALEDLLGAGAILSHLPGSFSPEAEIAATAFQHASANLPDLLFRCGSGKELAGRGFAADVHLAGQLDASSAAPLLAAGAYQDLP